MAEVGHGATCECCDCSTIKRIISEELAKMGIAVAASSKGITKPTVVHVAKEKGKRKPSVYNLHIKECMARLRESIKDHAERFSACVAEWRANKDRIKAEYAAGAMRQPEPAPEPTEEGQVDGANVLWV